MNMKLNTMAAAVALAFSSLASAQVAAPVISAVAAGNTIYISGASAQANPLDNILKKTTAVFDDGNMVVKLSGPGGSIGYYGKAAAAINATQPNILVIYNSTNGSAAGLNQLLSTDAVEAEATVLTLATCGAVSGTTGTWAAACTSSAPQETHMALSDVYASEFGSSGSLCLANDPDNGCPGAGYIDPAADIKTASTAASTGLEGFGVIVNANLYDALLAKNIDDGVLPGSCSTSTFSTIVGGSTPATCMPSIRKADYAYLAQGGLTTNADRLVKTAAAGAVTKLARRDELSGTQAASNIFFLNNVCGSAGYFGALTPARSFNGNAKLVISEETATGSVETTVGNTTTGFALGVVSSSRADKFNTTSKAFSFVKIDGVSPVHGALGAYDATRRYNIINGAYNFVTEMAAYIRNSETGTPAVVATAIANKLGSSAAPTTTTTVPGIAYIDNQAAGPADGLNSRYKRDGNNCAPMH